MPKHFLSFFKYLVFSGIFLISIDGFSQYYDSTMVYNPVKDDIRDKIPPLETLIDSAIKNSPRIRLEELKATRVRYDIKTERRKWTEHLGFEGLINYGHWYFNDRDELTKLDRFYLTESRRSTYNGQFYIKLPLFAIVDRRNNINKKKKELEMAMVEREIQIRELRTKVIEIYYDLVGYQTKLKGRMKYQEVSEMMMQMAVNRWLSGDIPAEEYNRQLDYKTRGDESYNETLRLFQKAYVMLEEVAGIKFNLLNVVK